MKKLILSALLAAALSACGHIEFTPGERPSPRIETPRITGVVSQQTGVPWS